MGKTVFIAEKPSVAQAFKDALKLNTTRHDGYEESENTIITWCYGHLVTMSYPDAYDEKFKKWSFSTLPFLPVNYKYEIIQSAAKQFKVVSSLLNRSDVEAIYVCTDSGREGEYIYRLVAQEAGVHEKIQKRVWIDSQTEEEIRRGIKEAKDISAYDSIADAAYLRAKEDYLMGINFSRALTLKYGDQIASFLQERYSVVSVGRVMTCVLGMVVRREREIRDFVKTPFYRVLANVCVGETGRIDAEFKAVEGSKYYASSLMYKENGFKKKDDAEALIEELKQSSNMKCSVRSIEKKRETKNPPLLYNLAELQNDCSKYFKISPAQTLQIAQELYEKKLTTYPRTDARVLSTAVSKEISRNLNGLKGFNVVSDISGYILDNKLYMNLSKTRYVNDKQITDHYAIIPTGQGLNNLRSVSELTYKVYELICRRFLSIFYPQAVFQKVSLELSVGEEAFFASFKVLKEEGYLAVSRPSYLKDKKNDAKPSEKASDSDSSDGDGEDAKIDEAMLTVISHLKKGDILDINDFIIKEGETSPPKRYNSGSLILAMENAGQLIEDEELREQIKGSGIGTSATRADILEKLIKTNKYLSMNNKTQIITPSLLGEMIYDVVDSSIKPMLDPKLTASWEKGLTQVAEGDISSNEYMQKLNDYVARRTNYVKELNNQSMLRNCFVRSAANYKNAGKSNSKTGKSNKSDEQVKEPSKKE